MTSIPAIARCCCAAALAAAATAGPSLAGQTTPLCQTADLAGAIIDVDAGAGNRDARVILTNVSDHACHTKGYVGGQLIDAAGHNLATTIKRTKRPKPRTVTIPAHAAAEFGLHWNVVPVGDGPCTVSETLRITPPDNTTTLPVFFGDTACSGQLSVTAIRR